MLNELLKQDLSLILSNIGLRLEMINMNFDPEQLNPLLKKLQKRDDGEIFKTLSIASFTRMQTDLESSLEKTKEIMLGEEIINSIDFIIGNELWNQYGVYGNDKESDRNEFSSKTYSRWRMLNINYGHYKIGAEFAYDHIGIVLKDYGKVIKVLPVTTDRGKTFSKDIEEAIVRVKSSDYPQFKNDSILLVHQITTVSKNRIKSDLFNSISKSTLAQQVEANLYKLYSPYLKRLNDDEVVRLNREIDEKNKEIEELKALVKK